MSNCIEIENLTRSFPEGNGKRLIVLSDLSLSIPTGETVALTGSSGSGKTTLLQIIGGLDRPTSGSVKVGGREVSELSDRDLARFRVSEIGFVFQFHHLLPDFTALENVMMPGLVGRRGKQECEAEARILLDEVGLSERLLHHPSELSGGERQRVALARALFNRPSLVLADEPTGNLDAENSEHFLSLVKRLNREFNQTFLIATHDVTVAESLQLHLHLAGGGISRREYHNGTV